MSNNNGGGSVFSHLKISMCCPAQSEQNQNRIRSQVVSMSTVGDLDIIGEMNHQVDHNLLHKTTVQLLKSLYLLKKNKSKYTKVSIFEALKNKRLNPDLQLKNLQREDLQYYIPQIITYLVFEIDLQDQQLVAFLLRACQLHYIFSHRCLFYLKSISIHDGEEIQDVKIFIQSQFLPKMQLYNKKKLCGIELAKCSPEIIIEERQPTQQEMDTIQKYGTHEQDSMKLKTINSIKMKNYSQITYLSTPNFWADLIKIGLQLADYQPKKVGLINLIKKINTNLPADVYIPFLKDQLQYYTILNIDYENARVYSTKMRSPYSIYIEIFREEEEFLSLYNNPPVVQNKKKKTNNLIDLRNSFLNFQFSKPLTVQKDQNSLKIQRKQSSIKVCMRSSIQQGLRQHIIPKKTSSMFLTEENKIPTRNYEDFQTYTEKKNFKFQQFPKNQQQLHKFLDEEVQQISEVAVTPTFSHREQNDKYFDKPFKQIQQSIRKKSIYKNFKTWKVVNIMIKTGDDMKQQQFAMQLINQFNIIFNKQKTGLLLRPYEVLSLDPDSGIIEMITDASPISKILKVMGSEGISTLKQFFKMYFKGGYKQAQKKFCRSLAAYSLVTYFLQIKDRHNQNILLHREGYIAHIDFGFFLSRAPGGKIQIEKKVPFKLMSNYVEVLGGYNSLLFIEFRSLFYLGFRAALKHKEEIIMLVKMMYSSHGESMPCFQKGKVSIIELQERFNPKTENLQEHCNNLINDSLDNWRARWYDRFQYYLQGIYY